MSDIGKLLRVARATVPDLVRLRQVLAVGALPELRNPHPEQPVPESVRENARPAGVLLPVITHDEPTLLLTRRAPHIRFGGQVCFPGGHRAEGDADLVTTALRETHEEAGVPPDRVDIIGPLGRYCTQTGYVITAIVGYIPPGLEFVPDPGEVSEIIEIPLAAALDPGLFRVDWRGPERGHISFHYEGTRISGPTVSLMIGLLERLAADQ